MDYRDKADIIVEERTPDGMGGFVTVRVVADRVEKGKPFLMKAGALSLIMKRNVMVEMDRDMAHFSTAFAVSDHYVAYLKYADRIVRFGA